jgi:hypothetical protein
MGFALELDNTGNFSIPDVHNYRSRSPRHRKPPRRYRPEVGELTHGAVQVAVAAARRARTVLATRPALTDHRRAF